jgi:hypothetical protein
VDSPDHYDQEKICQNRFGAAKVGEKRVKRKRKQQNKVHEASDKEQAMNYGLIDGIISYKWEWEMQ